jgi:hypothetical protein
MSDQATPQPAWAPGGTRPFADRLAGQFAHHYHLIVSIFKGIALYSASVALLAIPTAPVSGVVKATALLFWIAGFAGMIASYDGIMVGTIIHSGAPNATDLVAPFVMGVAEFIEFAVLVPLVATATTPLPSTAAQLEHLTWWPLVFGLYSLTAAVNIWNSDRSLDRELAEMAPDDRPVVTWYRRNLRKDKIGVPLAGTVLCAAWAALRFGLPGLGHEGLSAIREWQGLLGVAVLLAMVNAVANQERARRYFAANAAGMLGLSVDQAARGAREGALVDPNGPS